MSKTSKAPKPRNFVAKYARLEGYIHQDKSGDYASRCRQKRQWKRDLNPDLARGSSFLELTSSSFFTLVRMMLQVRP